ncbi:efflux RND transporter periplasmic adaptor subunit [Aequorivita echinoideorum]|uniref:Efflux RND transporter periplasmic adaptor subunit n=1 Tax=Aequorivita echinoideorum TaxID=1549647 RepID=A0ABS5S6N9_9FLAO|nr:efflux RND transporter periplasmic adaptor subunit [Aequorivita echinoideorum]MBT0608099.1 efflux RND transporter periplasmic adaptor subunit [Aequorivita echinoideorum]
MKKYIIYIAILAAGLILGYVFFGKSAEENSNTKDVSDMSDSTNEQNQMWTCSMHPQIMQPEPGDCPICGMDLIPAETGADGLAMNEIKMTENAMALANIQTTIVGNVSGTDENTMQLSGKIMANEEANAVQASYFEGRIEKLNVNFTGEEVRKGQLLATIYAPTLVAAQQELLTAASMKESQPALYKAVRNKLKLWKLSESQINQIESSGKVREIFPIYATVSGTVSQKMAEEGDYVKQGQPIVKVSDLATVWAMFDAYERQISQLKEGQKINVTTNAYPNKEFEATVSFIDPVLNTKSRTVSVRATLNNKEDLLKPGMFVTAKVQMSKGNKMDSQITVPATAVMWTGERSLVYIKTNPNEPVFEMREVTLGTKNGDVYSITEGLKNGDEVVTNGTFTVDAAAQLQGKKSMMNTQGGKTMTGHEVHLGMENANGNSTTDHFQMTKRLEVSSKFKEQLNTVFENYVSVDKALVNDDAETAKKSANGLQKSIEKVDMKLLKDDAHKHWMTLEKELKASTSAIANTSDIKKQREHFIHLSAHLINAVKTFGINQKVYVDFCPMANNNLGAYWLSKDMDIRNPYFGSDMLNCGSVTDEIE